MTLKTLFRCDFNVKTKSHLPISTKGMTKIPLPKKTSLASMLNNTKNTFVARTLTSVCQRHFWRLGKLALFSRRDVTMARHLEPAQLASSSLPPVTYQSEKFWLWSNSHVTVRPYIRTSVRPSVRTDSGRGRGVPRQPDGGRECHLFLAGNHAVLLGNPRFSWREIAWPSSLLKERFL